MRLLRFDLHPSYNVRRIVRAGLDRDGVTNRVVGVYLRLPDRIYALVIPSCFVVTNY